MNNFDPLHDYETDEFKNKGSKFVRRERVGVKIRLPESIKGDLTALASSYELSFNQFVTKFLIWVVIASKEIDPQFPPDTGLFHLKNKVSKLIMSKKDWSRIVEDIARLPDTYTGWRDEYSLYLKPFTDIAKNKELSQDS